MKTLRIYYFTFLLLCLSLASCKKDLDVTYNNEPDFQKVYASGDDLENIASGLYNLLYTGCHSYNGIYMFLGTASDNSTCSWGNQAMRDMSNEPRLAWSNASNYTYQSTTKYFFDQMYGAINTASNVIKAIDGGVDIGSEGEDNNMVKAFCKFTQGVGYGNLAMFFDKGFVVDEKTTLPDASVSTAFTYNQVGDAALKYLDDAIALCSNSFIIPAAWLGTADDYSNTKFAQLCNSMAARIMSNQPRNKTDLAAVNWTKVKAYADAGIVSDFTVVMDGYVKWYNEGGDYLTFPGWGQADMYVVHLMDPAQPQHWDDSPSFPWPAASSNPPDKRLQSDYQYLSSTPFNPTRGYYHFSNYRHSRWDNSFALGVGPMPELLKAENDLYKAEARLYANDLAGATGIINSGTWTTRGKLPPVTADKDALIAAIHHERHVELMNTGMGLAFFEMRKQNLLQKGTPLHWPLPAKTLETFQETPPFYTFGGVSAADGKGTSNAGWR